MLLIIFSYFEDPKAGNIKNHNFSPTLKSIQPSRPDYQSYIEMTCKNNGKDNYSPILKSIWTLELNHESGIDIICRKNIDDNYFPTLKNTYPHLS